MKHKHSLRALAMAAITLGFASASQADTIADWTFEKPVYYGTPTSVPYTADAGNGTLDIFHSKSGSTYFTANGPGVGNGSYGSVRTSNWSVGDYYQFSISTAGFESIVLDWDQTGTGGPLNWALQYSTDGSSFTDFASYQVLENGASTTVVWTSVGTPNAAYHFSYDLSSITALNDQEAVYFRLVDTSTTKTVWNNPNGSGTVSSSGYSWVDNFVVTASPVAAVPEPSTWALMLIGLGLAAGAARRRRANPAFSSCR
ncbi:PEPxxWA-CTERM sorting domain-containing protein [Methylobacillus caricis]|uniref:PEPxxWA-CTERM sorting domain-containing protein n=1 Tax=Methylobacillus caricis TaxID=1971611 RepID=UPI001CFFBC83|nr:PEPxxWA-CTERM sorting domain-containing protein [Methylobacillus caricis]MCB5188557.1 PEPxxWA-CTERM sorting domain-containing protein [Methylobacillus caricis]